MSISPHGIAWCASFCACAVHRDSGGCVRVLFRACVNKLGLHGARARQNPSFDLLRDRLSEKTKVKKVVAQQTASPASPATPARPDPARPSQAQAGSARPRQTQPDPSRPRQTPPDRQATRLRQALQDSRPHVALVANYFCSSLLAATAVLVRRRVNGKILSSVASACLQDKTNGQRRRPPRLRRR